MAVSSSTSKNQYTSSGESIFAYTFKIYAQADIKVLVDGVEQTITTDYTVSGVGSDSGGNITFVLPTTSGEIITIQRNEPLTQEIVYVEGDDFPAASHEEGLDRSVLRDQLLQEQIDRALTLPEGTTSTLAFTEPSGNGDKYLKLNTAANTVEYSALVAVASQIAITSGDAGKAIVVNATEDDIEVGSALGALASLDTVGTAQIDDDAVTADKLADTAVTPGSYTNTSLTVDQQGRITAASSGAASGLIQTVTAVTSAVATGTTTMPQDDTIPQSTEGIEVITVSITPTNASNKLVIFGETNIASTNAVVGTIALFQDSTAGALAALGRYDATNGQLQDLHLMHVMTAGTTSATTFKIRVGNSAAGTTTINGVGGARRYGGVSQSRITVMEVT